MTVNLDRRSALKAGAGLVAAPFIVTSAGAQARRIVVRDLGIGSSFTDAYARPFEQATGIKVVPVTAQHEPAGLIKQMVETKTFTWDMAIVSRATADQLAQDGQGYLEPLGIEAAAGFQALPDMFKAPHYAANDVVATVLAYRTDKVKSAPKSWADFWDVRGRPGQRAMRRFPFDTIEQALLADGVDPKSLYPCDFGRAFASLDRIKKDIAVWWTSGAQSSQLLQSGEVDYCPTWNGRAQVAINGGAPVALMWEQALWQTEGWAILKGTPNAALCREFIAFALEPARQAVFAEATGYGPSLAKAIEFVPAAKARALPTHPDNSRSALLIDVAFWASNRDRAADLFNRWIVS
ncbi:MAG: ABC transporter substrate-binding protein [Rhizobiales bacterium]|nr:ABC transporter substrate-binding protein [Hyphomicrobiales bacterium]